MKFKEIKPGMVIHCPKEEDARALLMYLGCYGYKWINGKWATDNGFHTGYYRIMDARTLCIDCSVLDDEITEFSDLIEPDDSPMTAVEVLSWLEKNGNDIDVLQEAFSERCVNYDTIFGLYSAQQVFDYITAYETAKKEPKPVEVEWVDRARIIQIDHDMKLCVYEEDLKPRTPFSEEPYSSEQAEAILKKYVSEHEGKYFAVIENVCRVKEDE